MLAIGDILALTLVPHIHTCICSLELHQLSYELTVCLLQLTRKLTLVLQFLLTAMQLLCQNSCSHNRVKLLLLMFIAG